jgi:hypothetical protein
VYHGEYRGDVRQGIGYLSFSFASIGEEASSYAGYAGEFQNGLLDGQGVWTWRDGRRYSVYLLYWCKSTNTDAEDARFEGLFVRDVPVEGILKPKDVREVDVWEDEEAQAEHMRAQAISCTSPRVAADEVCVKRQPLSLITTDAVPNLLLT